MISALSTGTELRRFRRGLVPKLALAAMILIPLLYGALYLWAFWDPTGKMDNLPVALVNEDVGTMVSGEPLDAGNQVTSALVESGDLKWEQVDAATAERGVKDGAYYFAVTIPESFSQQVASAAGDDPETADIQVTYNDANSFLATTLGRTAMVQLQSAVREQVGEQAVEKVLVGLGDARDGFAQASDGAVRLTAASGQVADGSRDAADGADQVAGGAHDLATGLDTLATGSRTAAAGATALDSGAGDLADGAATLGKGTDDLATGARKLSEGAGSLAEGTTSLSTGAQTLSTGAATVQQGTKTLAQGANQVVDGFTKKGGLVDGADSASAGATQLAAGLAAAKPTVDQLDTSLADLATLVQADDAALASQGMPDSHPLRQQNAAALQKLSAISDQDLAAKFAAATDGARALADPRRGLPALATGLKKAAAGAEAVADQLSPGHGTTTLRDGIDSIAVGSKSLAAGADRAASGASGLATGARSASKGATKLSAGAASLSQGSSDLHAGADKLATGVSDLAHGAVSAADGSRTLADGAADLAAGTNTLADGTGQLTDGAQTLADGLAEGTDQLPDDTAALQQQRASTIAAPVTVTDQAVVQAEGFGEGFAPFFISLALFVGSLISWLLLRPVPSRALAAPVAGWRITSAGYLPAFVIGVGQVFVMLTVIRLGLGLDLAHPVGTMAFAVLVVATFLALQQMLLALAGPAAGKVIILAVLMLQLAASGGTYPVPTTAGFFQVLHPWLPMSYAVTGLRQLITGGTDGRLWSSVAVLVTVLVGSLAVTSWRAGRMRTWSLDRLHPSVAI